MKNPISQIRSGLCNIMYGVPRSGQWRSVRAAWLKDHPTCAACGSDKDVEVHHMRPFHLYPKLELDPTNFISLCETMGSEDHLHVGHTVNGVSNWKLFNVNVIEDAAKMLSAHTLKKSVARSTGANGPSFIERFFGIGRARPMSLVPPMIIETIEGVDIHYQPPTAIVKEYVCYTACLMVDDDGSGPRQGDPCYQNDTTLHKDGKPLNALIDKWIVVPPQIIEKTKGIVMGCLARITRISTGAMRWVVVGDKGPPEKIGEGSQATVLAMGDDDNPIFGGDDEKDYIVEIWPGQAAPGYTLQAA